MIINSRRAIGVAIALLTLATGAAAAQGKSKGKPDKGPDKDHDKAKVVRVDDRNHDGIRDGVYRDGVYRNGVKVPPGLAKKPGGMPPGQYKKRYGTLEGATVLGDILGRRGYTVIRTTPSGASRYVYYRGADGLVRRAVVSQGTERLTFTNVPATLLQEVLARLY
ncbi:MAG: hypothetical protein V4550_07260 [Gemmatimonadota bacterium]